MKRLLVVLSLVFLSLNFVACAQKKDSKTRLTKGSGRQSAIVNTTAMSGWNIMAQNSEEVMLTPLSGTADDAARAFMSNDSLFVGPSQVNSIVMRLSFIGTQINSNATMAGFKFYDNWDDPLAYFLGASMNRRATGTRNGNQIHVEFEDVNEDGQSLGKVIIDGQINGARFVGRVDYNGGTLGRFDVTASYAIY